MMHTCLVSNCCEFCKCESNHCENTLFRHVNPKRNDPVSITSVLKREFLLRTRRRSAFAFSSHHGGNHCRYWLNTFRRNHITIISLPSKVIQGRTHRGTASHNYTTCTLMTEVMNDKLHVKKLGSLSKEVVT